jgi:hypothetical protein
LVGIREILVLCVQAEALIESGLLLINALSVICDLLVECKIADARFEGGLSATPGRKAGAEGEQAVGVWLMLASRGRAKGGKDGG